MPFLTTKGCTYAVVLLFMLADSIAETARLIRGEWTEQEGMGVTMWERDL